LDPALADRLAARFVKRVMAQAHLPDARRADVEESVSFVLSSHELFCTCDITGSTKQQRWRGRVQDAEELVDDLAEETVGLVTQTPHYAWLRASR
jgi:hypothetical protein